MEPQLLWQRVSDWLTEESVSRAAALAGGAALALLTAGWRLLRRPKGTPERTVVHVDAPRGEAVRVRIGDENEQRSG